MAKKWQKIIDTSFVSQVRYFDSRTSKNTYFFKKLFIG